MKRSNDETQYIIDKGEMAYEDITTELCYQSYEGKVYLAWNIRFAPMGTNDLWNTQVDAVHGRILAEENWTVYCNQGGKAVNGKRIHARYILIILKYRMKEIQSMSINATESYTVWPFPLENPRRDPVLWWLIPPIH
jgi:hypothetical protein